MISIDYFDFKNENSSNNDKQYTYFTLSYLYTLPKLTADEWISAMRFNLKIEKLCPNPIFETKLHVKVEDESQAPKPQNVVCPLPTISSSTFMRLLKTLKIEIQHGSNFVKCCDTFMSDEIYRSKTVDINLIKYVLCNNIKIYDSNSYECKDIKYETNKYTLNPRAPPIAYYSGSIRDYINENIHFTQTFLSSIGLSSESFQYETRLTVIDDKINSIAMKMKELEEMMKELNVNANKPQKDTNVENVMDERIQKTHSESIHKLNDDLRSVKHHIDFIYFLMLLSFTYFICINT